MHFHMEFIYKWLIYIVHPGFTSTMQEHITICMWMDTTSRDGYDIAGINEASYDMPIMMLIETGLV